METFKYASIRNRRLWQGDKKWSDEQGPGGMGDSVAIFLFSLALLASTVVLVNDGIVASYSTQPQRQQRQFQQRQQQREPVAAQITRVLSFRRPRTERQPDIIQAEPHPVQLQQTPNQQRISNLHQQSHADSDSESDAHNEQGIQLLDDLEEDNPNGTSDDENIGNEEEEDEGDDNDDDDEVAEVDRPSSDSNLLFESNLIIDSSNLTTISSTSTSTSTIRPRLTRRNTSNLSQTELNPTTSITASIDNASASTTPANAANTTTTTTAATTWRAATTRRLRRIRRNVSHHATTAAAATPLVAFGAILLLAVLWVVKIRAWGWLPKLWQLVSLRKSGSGYHTTSGGGGGVGN